ncbi:MAG: hypothetical protein ACYDH5_14855 [Acidimicrobiales bacterium]
MTSLSALVVMAALGAVHFHWLDVGHSQPGAGGPAAARGGTVASQTSAHPAGTRSRGAGSGGSAAGSPGGQSMTLVTLSHQAGSASYAVPYKYYTVSVQTDRPTWLEVAGNTTSPPLYARVMPAGAKKAFTVHGSLTVRIGAGGSLVSVTAGHHRFAPIRPRVAPYDVTFSGI